MTEPEAAAIDAARVAEILSVMPRPRFDALVATLLAEVVALGSADPGLAATLHRLRGSAATLGLAGLAAGLDRAAGEAAALAGLAALAAATTRALADHVPATGAA